VSCHAAGRRAHAAWLLLAAVPCAPSVLVAQEVGTGVECNGQPVSDIQVVARPPFLAPAGSRLALPVRFLTSLHVTTNPDIIRRWVLLAIGEPCDERKRSESERILRQQPYIARASVRAVADTGRAVFILVETTDEYTPIFSVAASGAPPLMRSLRIGEGNVNGEAVYTALEWRHGTLRDTWGARVVDYQLLGHPYLLDASAVRGDAGSSSYSILAAHPLYTDLQRFAWQATTANLNYVFNFVRPTGFFVPLGQGREFTTAAGVARVGEVGGLLGLLGFSFSQERDTPSLPPAGDSLADTTVYDSLFHRYAAHHNARFNAIFALRDIHFITGERLGTLNGAQDLGRGIQLGGLFGRSFPPLGATDDDILVGGELYLGAGSSRSWFRMDARAEARYSYNDGLWDGIVVSTRMTGYQRAGDRNTLLLQLDAAGGWRTRIPFQLQLGEADAGVRGYIGVPYAGGQRAVVRLEDRLFGGTIRQHVAYGMAFFVNAGRVWAGDVPFGVTTPTKMGVGMALLAAFPAESKRTWRLEFAFPTTNDALHSVEIRFRTDVVFQLGSPEPRDVSSARERAIPQPAFDFP